MQQHIELIGKRLTQLRLKRDISESKMSRELGQSKGYIQQITSGRSLPSMGMFLTICEYLGVTPQEFFDIDNKDPYGTKSLMDCVKGMENEDLRLLEAVANRIKGGTISEE